MADTSLSDRLDAQTKRLAASDGLFRLLVSSVSDYAIFMLDPSGRVATWNVGAHRLKGYTANEIIGRHFSTFYPAAERDKCARELETALRDGRVEDEGWRVRKDGSQFWANVVISAVYDEHGSFVGFAKITRDLSERQKAIEDRQVDEARFRLLVETVRDYAIFHLDVGGLGPIARRATLRASTSTS